MDETGKQKIISALNKFYKELRSYKNRQSRRCEATFSETQIRSLDTLRLKLQRDHGRLHYIISKYGGNAYVSIVNIKCEVFSYSLSSLDMGFRGLEALDAAISVVNRAIGKLESTPSASIEIQDINVTQCPENIAEMPNLLFDKMQFYPKVIEASRSCFVSGNYREAILNAFIKLIDYVKEITGLDLDGDDLMNRVFSFNYDKERRKITKYPLIRINELKNISDRDEQQGFMFLCKGAVAGIRNPKAHTLIPQTNPLHTLEYLALASLLIRRIEESKVVKSQEGASS